MVPSTADISRPGAPGTPHRRFWLAMVLGPAACVVGTRWWLQFRLERMGVVPPPGLSPAGDPESLIRTLGLVGLACVAFACLAWWLVRKPGPWRGHPAFKWTLLGIWVLACGLGTLQAVRSHFNALGLSATRIETLRVVGLRAQPPSLRSPGGTRLFLDWPAQGGLHSVLLESFPDTPDSRPALLQLQLAPGRWQGWYVLGWTVPASAAVAVPAASLSSDKATP